MDNPWYSSVGFTEQVFLQKSLSGSDGKELSSLALGIVKEDV